MDGHVKSPKGYDPTQATFYEWVDEEFKKHDWRANKCECGVEKVHGREAALTQPFLHSFWCPMFEDTREKENSVDKVKKSGYDW